MVVNILVLTTPFLWRVSAYISVYTTIHKSGNVEVHEFASLLNIFIVLLKYCLYGVIFQKRTWLVKTIECEPCKILKATILDSYLGTWFVSRDRNRTRLIAFLEQLMKKEYKPTTTTTKHDLQTKLAPKEEIRY
jgi:hypothetical protein